MNSTSWSQFVICALLAAIVTGCPSMRKVTLNTNPIGADVMISSDRGLQNFPIGKTTNGGLTYVFGFDTDPSKGPSMYNVDLRLEGHEAATIAIRKDDEQYDPEAVTMKKSENLREFYVKLRREVVREVERLEPQVTEEGYVIEPRVVRAWVEDIEREAMGASNIVKLAGSQSIAGMAISANGGTLVFSLVEKIKDEQGKEREVASLRSIQTKGGGVTQITSGQWLDTFPTISSDGFLYFCSNRLRKNSADIFRVSSEKIGAIAVIRQTPEGINYQPSVADTGVIAFTYKPIYQGRFSGSDQVWTLGGENQYPTQLREGSMPVVSPDGTQIAFTGPDRQLWKVPVDGQSPVQLTSTPIQKEGKKHPAWSPDGKYILYASDEGKDSKDEPNYDIWMMCEDGTGTRQLTTNGSVDDFPIVSPDQKYVYFVSNRGFKEGIWRIPFPIPKPD